MRPFNANFFLFRIVYNIDFRFSFLSKRTISLSDYDIYKVRNCKHFVEDVYSVFRKLREPFTDILYEERIIIYLKVNII